MVLVGHLNGKGYPGANFNELLYLINVDKVAHRLQIAVQIARALIREARQYRFGQRGLAHAPRPQYRNHPALEQMFNHFFLEHSLNHIVLLSHLS